MKKVHHCRIISRGIFLFQINPTSHFIKKWENNVANLSSRPLDANDPFSGPYHTADRREKNVTARECLGPDYGVFLFYRGSW